MTRDELTRKILAAKRAKGLTWKTIVAEIGGGTAVYLTAALMGQMRLHPEQAERAAKLFGLDAEEQALAAGTAVSGQPAVRRAHRSADLPVLRTRRGLWHHLEGTIQEEFGDGIMSAIDFDMAMERQPDQEGDRVKLTMSGKFLPQKRVLSTQNAYPTEI